MTTFVFPGQGSQAIGMGSELFPLFPEIVQQADEILGYSLIELCLHDDGRLNQTAYTQPALFTVNALHWLKKQAEMSTVPQYVAGHSLGEYNALFAAGVFDFATGLALVKKRGELMSQATGGAMAAIIGLTAEAIAALIARENLHEIDIANFNSYTQTVITGKEAAITASRHYFETAGATFFPLKVSGAFHSRWMQPAQHEFAEFIKQFPLHAPKIPVVANITARPLVKEKTAENLVQQIASPVLWLQSMQWLLAEGETEIEEIGPGRVLAGLLRKIRAGK